MVSNPQRRELLADAGLRVLARAGARGLTHRAVDREAGVPAGTASNYFRSRDALLNGLAERIFARMEAGPDDLARLEGRGRMADYLLDIVRRTTREPDLMRALFELRLEGARRPELRRLHYALDGLLLDLLGTSIGAGTNTDEVVEAFAARLVG
jgi:DNA-binding transcriptional regulator YbjK